MAVLALPVAVIESALRALLVAAIGGTTLLTTGGSAAGNAAVAVSAIAMRAHEEHSLAVSIYTNPLPQNRFAVRRHAPSPAALDNGGGFVAP
jgi:hypothetical protein